MDRMEAHQFIIMIVLVKVVIVVINTTVSLLYFFISARAREWLTSGPRHRLCLSNVSGLLVIIRVFISPIRSFTFASKSPAFCSSPKSCGISYFFSFWNVTMPNVGQITVLGVSLALKPKPDSASSPPALILPVGSLPETTAQFFRIAHINPACNTVLFCSGASIHIGLVTA